MLVKNGKKIKNVPDLLKRWENWLNKIFPPTQTKLKMGGWTKIWSKQNHQSSSILPEIGRKLIENDFWSFKQKDPSKFKKIKVLVDEKYLLYFYFFKICSCLSLSSRRCSSVSPSNFSLPPSLPSYVILDKVGKKESGSGKMEEDWYRTRVLVEKMPTIEDEEIPISWFSWVEIPSSGVAFIQV